MAKRQDVGQLDKGAITPAIKIDTRVNDLYYQPTREDVPEPSPTNNLVEVGKSLSNLSPTLSAMTGFYVEEHKKDEYARAEQEFIKSPDKWTEAVRKGAIDEADNPHFRRGIQRSYLKRQAEGLKAVLLEEYETSGLVNETDPAKIEAFINDHRKAHADQILANGGFNPRDVAEVYGKITDQAAEGLATYHSGRRKQAIRDQADDELGKQITFAIENNYDGNLDHENGPAIGENLNSQFKYFTQQMGMDRSRANKIIVDTVISMAELKRDRDLLDVLEHIHTPGGQVSKSGYAVLKINDAKEKITRLEYMDLQQGWAIDDRRYLENVTRKRNDEEWARSKERWDRQKIEWSKLDGKEYDKAAAEAAQGIILKGLELKDMGNPEVLNAFEDLRQRDPSSYMTMKKFVETTTRERSSFVETEQSRQVASQLRHDIAMEGERFNPNRILQAANDSIISDDTAMKLYDDYQTNRFAHPFMADPEFKQTADNLYKVVIKDPSGEFGDTALRGGEAVNSYRAMARAWIEAHPNANRFEFLTAMQGIKKTVAAEYAPADARPAIEKAGQPPATQNYQKQLQEQQAQYQQQLGEFKKQMEDFNGWWSGMKQFFGADVKQPEPPTPPTPPLPPVRNEPLSYPELSVRIPEAQKRELAGMVTEFFKPAIKEKPTVTDALIQQRFVEVISPILIEQGRPQDLPKVVKEFMELVHKKKANQK